MSTKNAIVLVWEGKEFPESLYEQLAEVLTTNGICIPEMLKMRLYDQDSIADAILNEFAQKESIVVENTTKAIESAVILIGKRFENTLNSTNIVTFMIELGSEVRDAKDRIGFNTLGNKNDKALLTAVEVLSDPKAKIPKSLASKYHITPKVIEIIRWVNQKIV